jgi:hypothetical protein
MSLSLRGRSSDFRTGESKPRPVRTRVQVGPRERGTLLTRLYGVLRLFAYAAEEVAKAWIQRRSALLQCFV